MTTKRAVKKLLSEVLKDESLEYRDKKLMTAYLKIIYYELTGKEYRK